MRYCCCRLICTVLALLTLCCVSAVAQSQGAGALVASSEERVDLSLARRASAAVNRASLAAGRAYIAVLRTAGEMQYVAGQQTTLPSLTAPQPLSGGIGRTRGALQDAISDVEHAYRRADSYRATAREIMHGSLPAVPGPTAVPEWAESVKKQALLQQPLNPTTRDLVLYLEELAFRIEQLAQETEICEEQAIGLAELATAKRSAPTVQPTRKSWRYLGPSGIPDGEGFNGSRVPVSGRVTSLAVIGQPGRGSFLLVGSALGGVWRSEDLGRTWRDTFDRDVPHAIGALAVDAHLPGRVYAGTGEANVAFRDFVIRGDRVIPGGRGGGLLRSDDGGRTWSRIRDDPFVGAAFAEITASGVPGIVLAATTGGLYRSLNYGEAWSRLDFGVPDAETRAATSVVFNSERPTEAFVAIWGLGVFRTNDIDAAKPAWERISGGLPLSNVGRIKLAWSSANPNVVYALIGTADHRLRGLYVSEDSGQVWSRIEGAPDLLRGQGFYHLLLAAHPREVHTVFVGGAGERQRDQSSLYRVSWIGSRWSATPIGAEMHIDFHAMAFDPNEPNRILVGNDGGVWLSEDGGRSWTARNDGLGITQVIRVAQHPSDTRIVFAGTQDNGTLRYEEGRPWQHVDNGDGGAVLIDHGNPETVYNVFFGHRIARSDSGGMAGTFSPVYPRIQPSVTPFLSPVDLNPETSAELALGADRVYLSPDRGRSWVAVDLPLMRSVDPLRVSVVSVLRWLSGNTIAIGTSNGEVFLLERRESRWSLRRFGGSELWGGERYIAAISPGLRAGELLIGLDAIEGPTLWSLSLSAMNEVKTVPIPHGFPGSVYAIITTPNSTGMILVGSDTGVFASEDAGTTWTAIGADLPAVPVLDISLHPGAPLIRIGTFGRGVWELRLTD